jgi:hypothetical protein
LSASSFCLARSSASPAGTPSRKGFRKATLIGPEVLPVTPQDLALIAEVAGRIGPEHLPSRRAALYAAKVEDDSALREWVATADPRLGVVYALAYRMLAKRRVLDEPTLAEWVREALEKLAEQREPAARDLKAHEVDAAMSAVRRSRLFREDTALDRLGPEMITQAQTFHAIHRRFE